MKLGVKFAIAFFISSVASIAFISLLSYTLVRHALQKSVVVQQEDLTRETIDSVDNVLNRRLSTIVTLSKNNEVLSYLKTKGSSVFLGEVNNTFQTLVGITGSWKDIDVVDANGNILYSQVPQLVGKSISQEKLSFWFTKALRGESVYTDVFFDPVRNGESIIFAVPIVDKSIPSHPVLGVLFGHMAWNDILSVLSSVTGHSVELYNQQGLLIGSNGKNFKQEFFKQTQLSPLVSKLKNTTAIETITGVEDLISMVKESGSGSFAGNKWVLAFRTPAAIAFAPAANTAIITAALLLPVIIVVNILLLLFILGLLRPISLIEQVADEIAKGNLTKRVPHIGNDEIGLLADSFNRMADSLQELYQGLEKKVDEKTKELSKKINDVETMNSFMIKRELKLIELKKQIAELKQRLSEKES